MLLTSSWSQARVFRGWSHGPCHRSGRSGGCEQNCSGPFRVRMAEISSRGVQQSRRFVASMSPLSHGLAVLKIPRGDGTHLESRRATVTQFRAFKVVTLAPFRRSASRRATVTQIRALAVAPFPPCASSGPSPALSIYTNSRSSASAALTGTRKFGSSNIV